MTKTTDVSTNILVCGFPLRLEPSVGWARHILGCHLSHCLLISFMDYLPPYKILFENMRIMSRDYRKETNSLLLRLLGSIGIVAGATLVLAMLATLVMPIGKTATMIILVVFVLMAIPVILYYVTLTFAKAQEIGLAATQGRDVDFKPIRIWQHILYFLILGLPIVIISLVLMAMHLKEYTFIFSLADVSIFYLVPMAVVANGSAIDGIEQAYKLFRANPSYVCLCGSVAALVVYVIGTLPVELGAYLQHQSPSNKLVGSLLTFAGSFITMIVFIRYEPFYRAQIYQSMVAPASEEPAVEPFN
jgi:hypothetical protein